MQINKMLKQAQKLQEDMAKAQQELATQTVEGTAGAGAIAVTANGDGQIIRVKIDPAVLQSQDVGMLEDLVLTAANQALEGVRKMTNELMGKLTAGLPIPGLGMNF